MRSLGISFALTAGYMVLEIIGGIMSNSLALLSDAVHMFSHAVAIGVALLAMWVAGRNVSPKHTFGYHRAEALAAMFNVVFLWLVAGWILYEAFHRVGWGHGHLHLEPQGMTMFIIGVGGLIVNVLVVFLLYRASGHSVNIRAAFLHMLVDLMASAGVIVSAVLVWAFGWFLADLVISVFIALLTLVSSWSLLRKTLSILMEGAPEHVDVRRLTAALEELRGIALLHDVHCWTITDGYDVFMAHVLVDRAVSPQDAELLSRRMQHVVRHDFGVAHVTIQMERTLEDCGEQEGVCLSSDTGESLPVR